MKPSYWIAACAVSLCTAFSPLSAGESIVRVIEVTQDNFTRIVEQSNQPVIIEVYADWCSLCRRMAPILDEASSRYPNIRFLKINIAEQPDLGSHYDVTNLPTILFILPGKPEPVMKSTGLLSKDSFDAKIAQFQLMSSNGKNPASL